MIFRQSNKKKNSTVHVYTEQQLTVYSAYMM